MSYVAFAVDYVIDGCVVVAVCCIDGVVDVRVAVCVRIGDVARCEVVVTFVCVVGIVLYYVVIVFGVAVVWSWWWCCSLKCRCCCICCYSCSWL